MKKLAVFLLFALAFVPFVIPQEVQQPDAPKFMRGARPTPLHKIVEALHCGKATIHAPTAPPAQVIVVPKRLSTWGNSQYGDCVSAESAFAIAGYSTYVGVGEIFVTEATIISWAKSHGYLNGAELLPVMQDMGKDGVKDEGGVTRKAGKPSSVDYSNETTLQSAIAQGPVSIAIDANALPSGAGNKSGWYAFGGGRFSNTDHCVSLSGYGPTSELFKALGVPVPAGAPANGYLLYTWNTIGVVDHKWLMNTVVEAWVRNPTVTDLAPPPPPAGKKGQLIQTLKIPGFPDRTNTIEFDLPAGGIPAGMELNPVGTMQAVTNANKVLADILKTLKEEKVDPKKTGKLSQYEATLKACVDYERATGRPLSAADRKFFQDAALKALKEQP